MRPKKRILVMTEHGELRFVLRHRLPAEVCEEDGTGDEHPGRRFDLAIMDGRDGRLDLYAAAHRMQALVGPGVPIMLLVNAAQSLEGVQVNRVLYRGPHGAGLTVGILEAARELTRRKRGPQPVMPATPAPVIWVNQTGADQVERMMQLAAKVA